MLAAPELLALFLFAHNGVFDFAHEGSPLGVESGGFSLAQLGYGAEFPLRLGKRARHHMNSIAVIGCVVVPIFSDHTFFDVSVVLVSALWVATNDRVIAIHGFG